MPEHECKCRECKPELFPEVSSQTPGYSSATKHHPCTHPTWTTVDGEKVDMVSEALSGEKGWVVYFPPNPDVPKGAHPCKCRWGACTDVRYGHVVFGPTDPTKEA